MILLVTQPLDSDLCTPRSCGPVSPLRRRHLWVNDAGPTLKCQSLFGDGPAERGRVAFQGHSRHSVTQGMRLWVGTRHCQSPVVPQPRAGSLGTWEGVHPSTGCLLQGALSYCWAHSTERAAWGQCSGGSVGAGEMGAPHSEVST